MDHIDALLKLWRQTAHIWGQSDCLLSVGDYAVTRGVRDVTGLFRGLYGSEEGAQEQIAAYGGVCALIDLLGLPEIDTPERGDIVAVRLGADVIGGICTGEGVVMRLERGTVEIATRFVPIEKAWKVP